ncbi:hypothetical protein [Streptomyces sp. NBC_01426]|uniref:hypothetical protein n=1 Tax=Streptomyces sp. NBC_01426 TaxID=2975866 RepID=UPI003FCE2D88
MVEHLTEVCVVVALMGAGLAINRPPGLRAWATTWRLLGLAMPLTILLTAAAAGWPLGWPPAVTLLVAAALAPTDPFLAAEVRVGEPTDEEDDEDEVRFALTCEAAGLRREYRRPHPQCQPAAEVSAAWRCPVRGPVRGSRQGGAPATSWTLSWSTRIWWRRSAPTALSTTVVSSGVRCGYAVCAWT